MASEFDNLMLDLLVKRRAEAGTDVDPASEEGRQVSLEGHKVEQRAPLLQVYKQVEVARVVGRIARDGAEYPQMARTVATGDRYDVSTPRAQLAECHCLRAGTAADRRTSASILRTALANLACSVPRVPALFIAPGSRLTPYTQWHLPGGSRFNWHMTDERQTIHVSAEALERVAVLRLSGLPLSIFLVLLARLDSTGRAEVTQPELGKLLSTGPGKVWQSLRVLVDAGVVEPPASRRGFGRRTPYRIPADLALASSVPPRQPGGYQVVALDADVSNDTAAPERRAGC